MPSIVESCCAAVLILNYVLHLSSTAATWQTNADVVAVSCRCTGPAEFVLLLVAVREETTSAARPDCNAAARAVNSDHRLHVSYRAASNQDRPLHLSLPHTSPNRSFLSSVLVLLLPSPRYGLLFGGGNDDVS